MCGIFGVITNNKSKISRKLYEKTIRKLFLESQSRGKDASGIALVYDKKIIVNKDSLSPDKFTHTNNFKKLVSKSSYQTIIGHARMETNGSYSVQTNNQPIIKAGVVSIHNGIITNDNDLWKKHPDLKRLYEVDTEVINSLLRKYILESGSITEACTKVFSEIEGSASIACLFNLYDTLLLATNTGSLYTAFNKNRNILIFTSEKYFIDNVLKTLYSQDHFLIKQITPNTGITINLTSLDQKRFQLKTNIKLEFDEPTTLKRKISVIKEISSNYSLEYSYRNNESEIRKLIEVEYQKNSDNIEHIKRCTKCILPETMPLIEFDEHGVCNYCRHYKKNTNLGVNKLKKIISKIDKNCNGLDSIVAFSGGRDSSFGLHYAVKNLGLKPVAYSYDWGMLTDLGRRNQARMTGKLGIEHILISADIHKKRDNIRKNVLSWLKKPDLGTIPLFMAGDKQYFYFANKLKKQFGIDTLIMSENPLERTHFKTGFCNVGHADPNKPPYFLSLKDKIKLFLYYAKQYILNPSYINSSLIDTFTAFLSFYIIPRNYLYLFDYIKWDEEKINSTLLKKYNWELSPDTKSTWRIGDGTAPFYNYIYYTVAGFTENDTFRSNQIREGQINRETALKLSKRDNQPRIDSIIWYGNTIGVDISKAITIINSIPKLY